MGRGGHDCHIGNQRPGGRAKTRESLDRRLNVRWQGWGESALVALYSVGDWVPHITTPASLTLWLCVIEAAQECEDLRYPEVGFAALAECERDTNRPRGIFPVRQLGRMF